ncbi:MAG: nucleotidyltransferase domain-containing protein [Oscillospiraceae bacterium]|nr:nucleotidyltransferase domain-containing protein [Oscillospiraceae bacterium]MCL2279491.1 nucleotidyltransferase domain-containing protein [Oscillospiraceae bacterium]
MCNPKAIDHITEKVVQVAKENFGDKLDKVILYGSYARGENVDESDIDIMVLADIPIDEANRLDMVLTRFTNRLGMEFDIVVSLLVKDCETFYKYLPADPFYQNVMRDGVLLSA